MANGFNLIITKCLSGRYRNSARFLRKRLLQHFKSESNVPEEINAIWSVGAALWNRSLPEAYNALDSYTWSDDMRQLMDAVRETIQEMAYTLICRSYSSIKVNSAAQMLGMPQDVLAAALAKRGWLLDEETQLLRPTTIPTDSHEKISLDQLSKLEDIVVYLESS
ncbi:unnamed protein product [Umbelopsis vinacea]